MPRGDNPKSRANLKPNTSAHRTKEEQREIASMGGKASGKARAEYKTLTEALKAQCTPEVLEELTIMLVKRAHQGNLKAYELLRDQIGEKPAEKVIVAQVEQDTIDEMQSALASRRNADADEE